MCRVDGEDRADAYSVYEPIARKEHCCGECCRTILAGERYERHNIVYDGSASTHLVCSHCAVLSDWLIKVCGGTVIGELIMDIEEHAQEYNRADLKELATWARGRWAWEEGTRFNGFRGRPIPALPASLQVQLDDGA